MSLKKRREEQQSDCGMKPAGRNLDNQGEKKMPGQEMIVRENPNSFYRETPCSVVAVGTALNMQGRNLKISDIPDNLKNDGYLTLRDMNRFVRSHLDVRKREDFKRGERKKLWVMISDNKEKAIICVLGHYIYVEGNTYYSFFDNAYDDVVTVWWLK